MTLCHADPSMLPAILDIENAAFTCPWSEKSFREAFDSEHITVYAVLAPDGAVAGFSCLMAYDDEGEILNIAAHPDMRRQGIGQTLMDAMLAEGTENGVRTFYLEVRESNAPARHLYEKHGFEILGKRKGYYQKPVEDAVLMKCIIQNA
ncbi:MAG: ribosomal protein S18-alanine N-acetyltransferase [Clostridia bacterium]|nr:ribosomal protein S18-alanine N-acetyltransferase [Clostridia bacterium]